MTELTQTQNAELITALANYLEVKHEIQRLEKDQDELRSLIEHFVVIAGGSVSIAGLADAQMTAESTSSSYDAKAIDTIMANAIQNGDLHTAQALADARRTTTRKGYLRIKSQ